MIFNYLKNRLIYFLQIQKFQIFLMNCKFKFENLNVVNPLKKFAIRTHLPKKKLC